MIKIGKIHRNLFLGFFGLIVPLPNTASITKNYLLPLIRNEISSIPSGEAILLILGIIIILASFAWIKEVFEDFDRTWRFMGKSQRNEFVAKTGVVILISILVGTIVNEYLFF